MYFKRFSNRSVAISIVAIVILFMTSGFFNKVAAQNGNVVWTQVVHMNAAQAGSTSNSMGIAILRVTSDMQLTCKILDQKIDAGDMLTNSHIHFGAPGANGSPFIFLAAGIQNLGKNVNIQLTSSQFDELVNGTQPIYINVHSNFYPGGAIRGQIR
ncbi:MAG: CHRD domain-containing protein [Ginsengibacter sp.]